MTTERKIRGDRKKNYRGQRGKLEGTEGKIRGGRTCCQFLTMEKRKMGGGTTNDVRREK